MSLYLLIQIWQPCPLISIVTGGIAGVGAYPTWDPTSVLGLFLVLFCLFVCLPHFNSALGTLVRANTHICLHTHRGIYSTLRHKRAHMLTRSHKHICKVLHKRTNAWTLPKIWPNASTHAANTHTALAWQMAPARMPKHSPGAWLPLSGYQQVGNRVSKRMDEWFFFHVAFRGVSTSNALTAGRKT